VFDIRRYQMPGVYVYEPESVTAIKLHLLMVLRKLGINGKRHV